MSDSDHDSISVTLDKKKGSSVDNRCQNLFTTRPDWLDGDVAFGFLICPNRKCGLKLGVFSDEG
jgi:hypothetical protein